LNNEIGDKSEGLSIQQNINNPNDPECSMGMRSMGIPTETSEAVVRAKTSII
jgi:hypothetical protein